MTSKNNNPAVNHLVPNKDEIHPRRSIFELQKDDFQWSLFIQAYSAMQQQKNLFTRTDQTKNASYFGNIAGIHGYPNRPYPGEDTKPLNGYCHHGIPTFPTWHRAYVKTIEQSLQYYATGILGLYAKGQVPTETLAKLQEANRALRFPYLDWDNPDDSHIINNIVNNETISIKYSTPLATPSDVTNPLKCFVNFEDLGEVQQGTFSNPTSIPKYSPPMNTPFTPKGYPTIRHPTSEYEDDFYKMKLVCLEYHENTLVPGMYQMFQNDDYFLWSNHSATKKVLDAPDGYGLYSSIEVYHDTIHDAIGGNGGHMSFPPVAAFDPYFFLHHCNVDRLFALWQRCYPNSWFNNPELYELSDKYVAPDEALVPFYNNSTNNGVTSDDLRNYHDWGYTYTGKFFDPKYDGHPSTLLSDVLKYYGKDTEYPYLYQVEVTDIDKNAYSGPYKIRVFIGDQTVDEKTDPQSSKYYAGVISVFARGKNTICETCDSATLKGEVSLNKTLVNLDYDITVEFGPDLLEQSQLANQLNSFRNETVLVAVDQTGKLLYKWTATSGLKTPTVAITTRKNFVNDEVQNQLVNIIKEHLTKEKDQDADKLSTMSGKQIINLMRNKSKSTHENFLANFLKTTVKPLAKKKAEE